MNIQEYTQWTENTAAKLDTFQEDTLHMILGMVTEVGELADVFKKNMAYKKPVDWVNVQEELGDLMFYIASFCRICHLDLEGIINTNVKKLEARYPNLFNERDALYRNLDRERQILEE